MKLSRKIRDEIISAAMTAKFKEREKAHEIDTTMFADALFTHEFGETEKLAKALPESWANFKGQVTLCCDGYGFHKSGSKHASLKLSKQRRGPRYLDDITITKKHPLYKQACGLAEDYAKIEKEKEELESKLYQLVYSANTVAKLLELWPEAKQFVPAEVGRATTSLVPVGLADEVNKLLGIKK